MIHDDFVIILALYSPSTFAQPIQPTHPQATTPSELTMAATFANQASNISALRSKYSQLLTVSSPSLDDDKDGDKKGKFIV